MGLMIKIEETSKTPIYRQIMDRIIELVDGGTLDPGRRLPSTRAMADSLGVNRSTVYRAYQELWSLGYLASSPGSYSTVRKRPRIDGKKSHGAAGLIDWDNRITPGAGTLHGLHLREEARRKGEARFQEKAAAPAINFIPLSPDSRLIPVDEFKRCMGHVLAKEGEALLQYGDPLGYGPLREYIAERMRLHGVSVSPGEIMITTGAQNALDLLLKLLAGPGAGVVIESPTYSRGIDLFRLGGVTLAGVPMDDSGMDLGALDRLLAEKPPAMVYTIPNFHNPTGITTGQEHRERLLGICERYRIPLVEDGFEEELKYFGKAVLPIKSMDHRGVVIYLGTFSKVLFPGLRIGWIAADRQCIDRLLPIQRAAILSGNHLDQAAVARFCRQGHYDRHIRRMHRVYRKRMQTALTAMERAMPKRNARWTRPSGGYILWVRLSGLAMEENDLVGHLRKEGVMVLPGSTHFYGEAAGPCFRLSIAHLDEAAITEGIRRLGACLTRLYLESKGPHKKTH